MSIYSEPYPADGAYDCSDTYTANRIMSIIVLYDGRGSLTKADLMEFVEFIDYDGKPSDRPYIKSGIGVAKIRRRIAALWLAASDKAKEAYLVLQLNRGVDYTIQCAILLRTQSPEKYHGLISAAGMLELPMPAVSDDAKETPENDVRT